MDSSRQHTRAKSSRSRSPTQRSNPPNNSSSSGSTASVRAHNNDQNKLRAQILKARLTKAPNLADLERQLQLQLQPAAEPPSRIVSV
ncbi:hypothetical protein LPJ53_005977, partial [Coemansia erecta]